MTITRPLTSLTVAAALAATALGPMATAANADGWRGRGGYHTTYRNGTSHWNDGPRHRFAYRSKRDNTGRIIALGLGALMLGIIASQASHNDYRYHGNYD